jgi:hypothetical protein
MDAELNGLGGRESVVEIGALYLWVYTSQHQGRQKLKRQAVYPKGKRLSSLKRGTVVPRLLPYNPGLLGRGGAI